MAEDIINIPKNIILRGIISQNLKSLRKKHGITQEELSNLTKINRVTIAKYESCESSISLNSVLIICKALNESPLVLLEGWETAL